MHLDCAYYHIFYTFCWIGEMFFKVLGDSFLRLGDTSKGSGPLFLFLIGALLKEKNLPFQ